ncbi:MAG: hypothetical protein FJ104_07140 [Deltaproteobacteria bacterium]|nr:hypothetical protein [Deltaproteobacteria bacterium]
MDWDAPPLDRYDSGGSAARLWVPAPGVIVTRASGQGTLAALELYTRRMNQLIATGQRHDVFHHWRDVKAFDPEAREHLRTWAAAHADRLHDASYLVASRLLSMALSVAALALRRDLFVTTREGEFAARLDRALVAAAEKSGSAGPTSRRGGR